MYYIGIKQDGFNAENLLSENSMNWLTYFNPDSKLKIQFAKLYNTSGVKTFDDINKAIALRDKVVEFGYDVIICELTEYEAKVKTT